MGGKGISIWIATAVGLGAIIGAGVFVLSGTAIAIAGSYAILAFVLVGIIALMVALQLGELGSMMPKLKGAAYSYVYKAFGSELGFISGIMLYFSYATGIAVISLGFGSYLSSTIGLQESGYGIGFAIALIGVLSLVNLAGIKKAAKTDSLLVLIKMVILSIFIAFAVIFAMSHSAGLGSNFASLPSQSSVAAIFAASVVIFFAYTGFQVISTFMDRVRGGARAAAKALAYSVLISMLLYVLVAIALIVLVPAARYSISADPLSFALKSVNASGYLFLLVNIGALIATTSAALAFMLGSSRILYQISRDKLLPGFFSRYDKGRDVASNAVIASAVIGVVMLFSGNIYVIAAISNFGLVFTYILGTFALVHFRRRNARATFRAPLYPYLQIACVVGLLALMAGMPGVALEVGIALVIGLVIAYYLLREINRKKVARVRLFG